MQNPVLKRLFAKSARIGWFKYFLEEDAMNPGSFIGYVILGLLAALGVVALIGLFLL
jgi:hypothetical protein